MSVKTRIGLGILTKSRSGSVELPEEVTLYCPQCGTKVADKGQCSVSFANVFDEFGASVLRLLVDCRNCGCHDREPSQFPKKSH